MQAHTHMKIKLKLGRSTPPPPPPPPRDYAADELCVAESLLLLSQSFFPSTAIKPISPAAEAPPPPPPPPPAAVKHRYMCDVCGSGFPSFQALGGHKTCHRPKTTIAAMADTDRFHDCSECGKRFQTGQALGGHKRKHYEGQIGSSVYSKSVKTSSSSSGGSPARESRGVSVSEDGGDQSHEIRSGRMLSFDLNLPYEPDDLFE